MVRRRERKEIRQYLVEQGFTPKNNYYFSEEWVKYSEDHNIADEIFHINAGFRGEDIYILPTQLNPYRESELHSILTCKDLVRCRRKSDYTELFM